MKNLKRGFVFAETVVVVSVVSIALLGLYSVFYTVYNEENKRINYDNSQDLYALYYVRKYLNENDKINDCLLDLNSIQDNIYFKEISKDATDKYGCNIEDVEKDNNEETNNDNTFLGKMKPVFEIEKLYLIKGNKISSLKKSNTKNILDEEIVDYIRTMRNSNSDNEYYLLGLFKAEANQNIEDEVKDEPYRVASIKIIKG